MADKPTCEVDHLIITAPTLEIGAAYVRAHLGVTPQKGGEHPGMGTHNLLLSLGPSVYLEVIAINPAAPARSAPRWFGLDDLASDAPARLYTWAARSPDLAATALACPEPLVGIVPMSRGALNWLITSPKPGQAGHQGITPILIQWQTDAHPAATLPASGLLFTGLTLASPHAARVQALCGALNLQTGVTVGTLAAHEVPRLVAHIQTPSGVKTLGSA